MKTILPNSNSNRKKNDFFTIVTLFFVLLLGNTQSYAQTYYLQNASVANASTPGSWKTDSSGLGGGTAATSFTSGNYIFNTLSGQSATFTSSITLGASGGSGSGSVVNIISGSTVTINTGVTLTLNGKNANNSELNVSGTIVFGATAKISLSDNDTRNKFVLASGATFKTANVTGVLGSNCSVEKTAGVSPTATLNAAANYEFSGANQATLGLPATVNNLTFSGSGTKTLSVAVSVSSNLLISSGIIANLGSGLSHTAHSLTLVGLGTNSGTWGSTTATATYKNNTYFSGSGNVNVTNGTGMTPTVTPTIGTYTYNRLAQGPNTATNTGTGTNYTFNYVGVSGTTYGPSATLPTNAGNYTVTATVADSADGFYRSAASSATSFTISARSLTITGTANSKTYDGNTSSVTNPTLTSGTIQSGDTAVFIQTYNNKNVGTSKTMTPSGVVTDGNSGNNYSYTFVTSANGTIAARALTITGAAHSKIYDTTTSSATNPAVTSGTIQTGDSAAFTQTYDSRNVGISKTMTPVGVVTDGNSGNNYSYTFVNSTNGTITARALTITGVANSKMYDRTTSSAANPTVTSGTIQSGDTAAFTQTYDTKNVGTNKTMTPVGVVTDGNSGNNYSYTFVFSTNGTITARA